MPKLPFSVLPYHYSVKAFISRSHQSSLLLSHNTNTLTDQKEKRKRAKRRRRRSKMGTLGKAIYSLGSIVRATGKALDRVGNRLQGSSHIEEHRNFLLLNPRSHLLFPLLPMFQYDIVSLMHLCLFMLLHFIQFRFVNTLCLGKKW